MEPTSIIWIVVAAVAALLLYSGIRYWVVIYNKFVYWINKVEGAFANIDVIMQQRIDMLLALGQVIKKYDIHEYKTLKDVIEARSRWSKDASLQNKVKAANDIENNFIKIQAVFEKYPKLRAAGLHKSIMGRGNISRVESKLRNFRLSYNQAVRGYNERVQRFPRNLIAKVHGFEKLPYLTLGNEINQGTHEGFQPKGIFND
jgi:LemA protein